MALAGTGQGRLELTGHTDSPIGLPSSQRQLFAGILQLAPGVLPNDFKHPKARNLAGIVKFEE